MSLGNILKTIFFTVFVVGFFFIIWIKNPFVQEQEYPLPAKYRAMIYSDNPQIIAAGRQIVTQQCAACHSLRYDGVYPLSVKSDPNYPMIIKQFAKPIPSDSLLAPFHQKTKGFAMYLPQDVYDAAFAPELHTLKTQFGKVPPDLSTMYLARGPEYLFNWVQNPGKIIPGTAMPAILHGQPKEAAEVVAYLRAVDTPTPAEQTRRFEMGVVTLTFLILFGIAIYIYRGRLLDKMGLH
jgi:ubiquinol-cytochrome c reductase cytochrome c1 subunit